MRRSRLHALAAALAITVPLSSPAAAQEAPKSIKIGYVISLSGPQSAGAMLTTVPNYRLWVDEVNKAGGLLLKKYNKRIPIEVSEIDDRSNNEDMVRLVERLMTVDKVDIVLSPWGTGPNLQAAPVFAKNGYPQLVGTGNSDKIPELRATLPDHLLVPGRAQRRRQGAG
jgi:branched-chain amino acid transport system substrate-binding protein